MSEESTKITWSINLKCYNCSNVWTIEVLKGYRLHFSKDGVRILEDSQEDTTFETTNKILCPNCLCGKNIRREKELL